MVFGMDQDANTGSNSRAPSFYHSASHTRFIIFCNLPCDLIFSSNVKKNFYGVVGRKKTEPDSSNIIYQLSLPPSDLMCLLCGQSLPSPHLPNVFWEAGLQRGGVRNWR